MSGQRFWWGDAKAAAVLQAWHAGLADDPAARAALRRVSDATEALAIPSYAGLVRDLRTQGCEIGWRRAEAMTAEAVAIAEIGEADPIAPDCWHTGTVARQFVAAWKPVGNDFEISGKRLQVLLGTEAPDLFLRLLRGALGMMRSKNIGVSVIAVAEIVRRHRRQDRRQAIRRAVLFEAALTGMFEEKSR